MKRQWSTQYLERMFGTVGHKDWTVRKAREFYEKTGAKWAWDITWDKTTFQCCMNFDDLKSDSELVAQFLNGFEMLKGTDLRIRRLAAIVNIAEAAEMPYKDACGVAAFLVKNQEANAHVSRQGKCAFISMREDYNKEKENG